MPWARGELRMLLLLISYFPEVTFWPAFALLAYSPAATSPCWLFEQSGCRCPLCCHPQRRRNPVPIDKLPYGSAMLNSQVMVRRDGCVVLASCCCQFGPNQQHAVAARLPCALQSLPNSISNTLPCGFSQDFPADMSFPPLGTTVGYMQSDRPMMVYR